MNFLVNLVVMFCFFFINLLLRSVARLTNGIAVVATGAGRVIVCVTMAD